MKRAAALAAGAACAAILAACGGPSVEDANREATAFCADHGGVAHVTYYDQIGDNAYSATCRDGSEIK